MQRQEELDVFQETQRTPEHKGKVEEIGLNMMGRRAVAGSGRSLDSTLNEM